MILDAKNTELIPEWMDCIQTPQGKEAFALIVGLAATLRGFHCHAQYKGEVRDFRFFAADGEQWFAFIPNANWLLFYFRKPAVRSGRYDFSTLDGAFDRVAQSASGEWTVRLRSLSDVQRLWALLSLERA